MKKIIIIGLMIIMMAIPVIAPNNQETGLDVKLMTDYGLDLVSYQISTKYKDDSNHFVVLEIVCTNVNNQQLNLKWIMLKEKYNELSEKV